MIPCAVGSPYFNLLLLAATVTLLLYIQFKSEYEIQTQNCH